MRFQFDVYFYFGPLGFQTIGLTSPKLCSLFGMPSMTHCLVISRYRDNIYWYFYNFITYFYTHAKLGLDHLIKILNSLLDSNTHFVLSIFQLVYMLCKQVAPVQVLYLPYFLPYLHVDHDWSIRFIRVYHRAANNSRTLADQTLLVSDEIPLCSEIMSGEFSYCYSSYG